MWLIPCNRRKYFHVQINLSLVLSTDGLIRFGNFSTNHASWNILLINYNLSMWFCMKCKFMMSSMIILGMRQFGKNINVDLSPLIEYLRVLWKEYIKVDSMLFCTINDFLAYNSVFGHNVKGHKVCPICEIDTCHKQQKNWIYFFYPGHQKLLRPNHPYHRLRKTFNGEKKIDIALKTLNCVEIDQRQ